VAKHVYECIIKQFMCEWIVEWTHSRCKTLNNRLEQNLIHNKRIFNV
jgi:transposase-like protein